MPPFLYSIRDKYTHIITICLLLLRCNEVCIAQRPAFKPGTDTQYINKLFVSAFMQNNPDSALIMVRKPMLLSTEGNYTYGIHVGLNCMARSYYAKTNYEQSLIYYNKSLAFCPSATDSAGDYYNIGNVYKVMGDYQLAAEYCYKTLELTDREHTSKGQGYRICAYNGLSAINTELKQEDEGFRYLLLAEKTARTGPFNRELVTILNNIGGAYRGHRKLDSALACLNESRAICEKKGLLFLEGEVDQEVGSVYFDSGLYNKAIDCYKASMAPGRCSDDCDIIRIYSSYGIAESLYKLKQYSEATTLLNNTIASATTLNIRDNLIEDYALLEKIYRATGNCTKAFECSDSVMALKDAQTGAEKIAAVNQMELKYKTAQKDKQLAQNQLIIAEQKNNIAGKNIWIISIGSGLLLLLLLSGAVNMRTNYKRQSLEKESRIQLLKATVEAGDNERTRIARELHDGIGGMLGASIMRFSSMHHENPEINVTSAYTDAMSILQDMGTEIRMAAHNLMPEVLLNQTLTEAVSTYCNTIAHGNKSLKIDFLFYGSFDNITQSEKLNLYRIIQELVKNVISHASATILSVQLMQNDQNIVLNVEDNGIGFDADNSKSGLGLHNIRTRVGSMGGQLIIESVSGKGTVVIVELPYTSPVTG